MTFLFTDVEGSTRRWEQHRDAMKAAMERHDRIVGDAIDAGGGVVFTTAGDEFCAAFSSAGEAVKAAVRIQGLLAGEEWGSVAPLRVRMAVHSGRAEERGGDYFGPPLNRCARLMSLGHGGQVLVSASAAELLAGDLDGGLELADLGRHHLKDLDRPEHVFQVLYPELPTDLPALRSAGPEQDAVDLVQEGRAAHASQDWTGAYEAFGAAARVVALESDDLKLFGDAAYWTGNVDEALPIKEKAFGLLQREGDNQAAAVVALDLAFLYKYRLAMAVSKAWLSRAEGLVGDAVDTDAYGYLLRFKSVEAFETEGDPEKGVALAEDVIACGLAVENRNLQALGLMDKGRFLVAMGRVDEGMVLVDEAMIAVVSGDLDASTTGRSFCNMLAVCEQVADYQRAAEWSAAAEEWCNQHSDSAYPGICRIYRAELKWLQGDWDAATSDLNRAVDELGGFTPIVGAALYQMGMVQMRAARYAEAGDLFRSAHEHGFTPLPGLAELRLVEGDASAAEELLLSAMVENPQPLERAKYLPVLIRAELQLGDVSQASAFLKELEETADLCNSTAMHAEAAALEASIARAEDRFEDTIAPLKEAIRRWTSLQMPFEAATARLQLSEAYRAAGSEAAAQLEADAATTTLQRLGATRAQRRM